ncbi:beta-galactosidase [Derxia lacustris]|uniref:beta-galactosidase n=1 Tax=Derxia lacustris TaxID=764842 RepID=UPI000A170239|nr:beta-galactosidase [Derxia lacustris]
MSLRLRPLALAALLAALSVLPTLPAGADPVADFAPPDNDLRFDAAGATLGNAGDGWFVPVTFAPGAAPRLTLAPPAGEWNWARAGSLRLHAQNGMPWAVTFDLALTDAAGNRLEARVALPPGPPQTLVLPLAATSGRGWGMVAAPFAPWLRNDERLLVATEVRGAIDRAHITGLTLSIPGPTAPQTLLFGKLFTDAEGLDARLAYERIVDTFGQLNRGQWQDKVLSKAELLEAAEDEDDQLVQWATEVKPADAFGGLPDAPGAAPLVPVPLTATAPPPAATAPADTAVEGGAPAGATPAAPAPNAPASGFFRTEKRPGADGQPRWWLITPAGNRFFSLGVNTLRIDDADTVVEGREFMFDDLPARADPLARFYGQRDAGSVLGADAGAAQGRGFARGRSYDFYRANLFRRDRDRFEAAWRDRAHLRLRAWGFNTVGNWSDDALTAQHRTPYVRNLEIGGDFARISDGHDWWGRSPDPFDPAFAAAADSALAAGTRARRDDPWLIGWFVDNELAWGNGAASDPRQRYALAYSTLRLDGTAPGAGFAKRAFVELLKARYGEVALFANAWGMALDNWEQLLAPVFTAPLPDEQHPAVAADLSAFLGLHAETYYRVVAEALKRHDPNHLYLGSRLASRTPEATAACARWCDVVSFNLYVPDIASGFEAAEFAHYDKPALLTEFHFGSRDRGPFWNGVMAVASEPERAGAYARMLASVAANPAFVGAHWFQYLDEPATGRWLDGENGHLGLVAITDLPWNEFVPGVRAANLGLLRRLGGE